MCKNTGRPRDVSHAAAVSTEVAAAAALAPAMAAVTLAAAVAVVAARVRCRSAVRATGPAAEPHSSGQSYSMHARPWVMGCNRTWFVLRRGSCRAKAASSSHSSVKIRSGLCIFSTGLLQFTCKRPCDLSSSSSRCKTALMIAQGRGCPFRCGSNALSTKACPTGRLVRPR